ncbi:MAG: hypothetical protein QM652_13665 [Legionella sp.]|uniref:hypothetical protein n=1 Tax=Legionella sp. TaxID=459 RepID=UPI0039E67931
MSHPNKYLFRLYLPAFLFSIAATELVNRSLKLVEIKKSLLAIYPSWFSYLLDWGSYLFLSFGFFIMGCLFTDTLPKLWEKPPIKSYVERLNNHSMIFERIFYIFMVLLIIFGVVYPFLSVISNSYKSNFSLGDTFESIYSGIFLAILFFLLRERFFGYPDLNNQWYLKSVTQESAYNPYKGMELHHQLFLVQDKSQIKGTAEKYYEDSSIGQKGTHVLHYSAGNRRRAYIEGTIQKNYFSPDILILHAIEHGEKRQSTIYCRIELKRKFLIGDYDFSRKGLFYSMVSSQKGYVVLSKEKFAMKVHSVDKKFLKKEVKEDGKSFYLKFLKFIREMK